MTPPKRINPLLIMGIPLIAYALIDNYAGPIWGAVAGIAAGLVEVLWEWKTNGKVERITWGSNLMILVLGLISIYTNDGLWFKLQPTLFEAAMSITLWVTCWKGPGVLVMMARKQNPHLPETMVPWMRSLSIRLGFFFLLHAGLNVWAALLWNTTAWALLKGAGLTISLVLYMLAEVVWMRRSRAKQSATLPQALKKD